MERFENHDCMLTNVQENVITQFIESGFFIELRRKLRTMCMISRKHPITARYFKSHSSCRNEEIRHLVNHYNMIHPFSKVSLFWEFYMFILLTCLYLIIPIHSSILIIEKGRSIDVALFILDVFCVADIIKIFFTGYYDHNKSRVILSPIAIAKRYICTYFIFDVMSCANSFIFPLRYFMDIDREIGYFVRFLSLIRIVRMFRWLHISELFRQYMGFSSYAFKGLQVCLIFCILTFWAFALHFLIEVYLALFVNHTTPEQWRKNKDMVKNFFDATTTLLMVSVAYHEGDYDPEGQHMNHTLDDDVEVVQEIPEYITAVVFLCFGFALQLFVYAQIIQVWTKYASVDSKRRSLYKQFEEYMKYKELPLSLQARFTAYIQFKFHKHFFKESDINNMISPFIKQEILMHVTRKHIEKVDFFKHLPENVLMKVVAQLKSEIFLPGDVIISAGTIGNSMFFIYHGTVAIFTPSGKEICHLEDGAHFGEIALILSETRVANVVAVTTSELFVLKRSDFLEAIQPYPECKDQLMVLATERLKKAMDRTAGGPPGSPSITSGGTQISS